MSTPENKITTTPVSKFDKVKPLIQSKVFWGTILLLVGFISPKIAAGTSAEELSKLASILVEIIGSVLTIYGRMKATSTIQGVVSSK